MVEAFPVAFLYSGQHVAVAIFSYMGWLNFGYLADAHGMPDVDVLAKGVEKSVKNLAAAARKRKELLGEAPPATPPKPVSNAPAKRSIATAAPRRRTAQPAAAASRQRGRKARV